MEKKDRTVWNPATRSSMVEFRKMVEQVRKESENHIKSVEALDLLQHLLWELLDDVENILDSEGVTL